MSRAAASLAGLLAILLAGANPAQSQEWAGERLCVPQLPSGAEFGSAAAVGDDGTIAVGDFRHDTVYLFSRDGAGACRSTTIQSVDRGSWFGFSLAIDGDWLLVGAPQSGGTGTAYLVDLKGGAPQPVLGLNPAPGAGDEVGSAVAMAGGFLAISARGAESQRGRVYVGHKDHLTAVSTPPELAPGAELGQSVAFGGGVLVMGAPFPFRGSGSPGAAFVLDLSSGGLPAALRLPDGLKPEAAFGYAVAVEGDRILIGAPLADGTGIDAGAVFSYRRGDGAWVPDPQPFLTGGRGNQLGVAVALDGGNAVVGARYANGTRGAAYLLGSSGSSQPLVQSVPTGAQFGFSAAIRGGIAVVGAFRENGVGAAYRFADAPTAITVDFAAAASAVLESAGTADLQVIVHGPADVLSSPVTVDLALTGGTATPGADFRFVPGSFVIPAGTPRNVPFTLAQVGIQPDSLPEEPETVRVQLSARSPAVTGAQSIHEITIYDSFLVLPLGPLHTSEAGGTAPLEVRLAVQPSANVVVSLTSSDSAEGLVSPDRLTFTPQNWQSGQTVQQTVQVTGQDNSSCGGNPPYEIRATTARADPRFSGLTQSVPVENIDDEVACLDASQTVCTDAGGTVIYKISLANVLADVPDTLASLQDTLPLGVSVVTASADRGTATADPVARSVHWTGPLPAAGDKVIITIVGALDELPSTAAQNHPTVTFVHDGRGHLRSEDVSVASEEVCP